MRTANEPKEHYKRNTLQSRMRIESGRRNRYQLWIIHNQVIKQNDERCGTNDGSRTSRWKTLGIQKNAWD